jgi:uncharacterized protein involved in exopolysaccharide biosynthesis
MDDDSNFGEYLETIKNYWALALICFILVLGAVAAYTFLSEPVYEAKSLVAVSGQDPASFLLGTSASKSIDLETQKVIIQSPIILYPIYAKYDMQNFKLAVNTVKDSAVLEIDVQSNSPENAMNIANDITASYINYTTDARVQDAQNNIAFIDSKIEAYNEELNTLDVQRMLANKTVMSRQEQLNYKALEREIAAKNKIYDSLLSKREEALIASNLKSANLKVIEYAELPAGPIKPNKKLNMILGVILALGVSVGATMVAESVNSGNKKNRR